MYNLFGKNYIFDINKISEFVNYSDKNISKEREILDSYEGSKVVSKTVRELTTPANAQIDNIKYDIIKSLMATVISYDTGSVGSFEDVPVGIQICFNTLIKEGFLIEI